MSNAQFSFHFRKEFLSNLPNIFILAIGVKYKEVSVCIAELIYRMVIYATNIDVVKCVSDLLAFDDKFPYGKPQTDEVARGSGTESMAVRD